MNRLTSEQRKAHNSTYYQRNKSKQVARNQIKRDELRKYVLAIKLSSSCKYCGETHPATLDFHHRDPSEKSDTIAKAVVKQWSITRLQAEIDKCDIVCANCHRKLHWDEKQ